MRSIRLIAVVLAVLVGLASCSRDPEVVKKRYLESGNKYFEKGRYKEASIQYRNALKRDQRYGAAYYRLALVSLKMGQVNAAVPSLTRAVELIKPDQPDYWDAVVKLSELYIAFGKGADGKVRPEFLKDVETYTQKLLARDPKSFDGHRLVGDLDFTKATEAYKSTPPRPDEGMAFLNKAIEEYRKADSVKPGQQGVSMQIARALTAKGDFAGAEAIYHAVLEKDKSFQNGYTELYRMFMFQRNMAAAQHRPEDATRKAAEAEQLLKLAFANNPKQFGYLSLLALHYYAMQRRDDMVGVLNQIKTHVHEFPEAYQTVGDFYLRMGDGDAAVREYREGIARDPKKKLTYQKRVIEVLMRQGKKDEAGVINQQILKDDPNDNDARGLSAQFMLDQGDINKALAELQKVVAQKPTNAIAHYNLGRAHEARREIEQARQQYLKAIELESSYIQPRIALAKLQMAHGEYEPALKSAEAILAIDNGSVPARLIQSAAFMGLKRFGESRTLLEAMFKVNPGAPDVTYQLGVLNLAEKNYKDAEEQFRRTYQLNPANLRGLMALAETYMAQNKNEEALKVLQTESDKDPNRRDLLESVAYVATRVGKFDLGLQVYNRVLAQTPKDPNQGRIYLSIGEIYRRKRDYNNAVQALQKARETLPQNPVVLSTLALILGETERKAEAKQLYEATLKIDPNNAVVLNNLAFLLAETGGDLDDALTKAQRAKQLLPNLHEVSDTLGWIYLKKNLADNAVEIFKDLVSKEGSVSTYHFHLGMAYSQKGDKSKALDQLKEALKYNPGKEEKDRIQALITRLG